VDSMAFFTVALLCVADDFENRRVEHDMGPVATEFADLRLTQRLTPELVVLQQMNKIRQNGSRKHRCKNQPSPSRLA
jgi:hypothetical protein